VYGIRILWAGWLAKYGPGPPRLCSLGEQTEPIGARRRPITAEKPLSFRVSLGVRFPPPPLTFQGVVLVEGRGGDGCRFRSFMAVKGLVVGSGRSCGRRGEFHRLRRRAQLPVVGRETRVVYGARAVARST
jgi:hypothetical protein